MSYADIIQVAANKVLLPPNGDDNAPGPYGGYQHHRYSCNAILFAQERPTDETRAASSWYYNTVLCADRDDFPASMPDVPTDETQNVRFMLLLFASYLAKDLGL